MTSDNRHQDPAPPIGVVRPVKSRGNPSPEPVPQAPQSGPTQRAANRVPRK